MSNPRLGHIVLGGCEGCYVSLLDAGEALLPLLEAVDLVASPLVARDDVRDLDVVLVEGAVTTTRDLEALKAARAAARTLVAVGSCAVLGGIGGLRNLSSISEVLETAYPDGGRPGSALQMRANGFNSRTRL